MMNHPNKKNCSVVVLAAGISSRMGFPKPLLQWNENTVFLEKIIQEYIAFGCKEIIVVVNRITLDFYYKKQYTFLENCIIQINECPELPRYVSIWLGLEKVSTDFCFIQNTDNPFVNIKLLELLFEQKCASKYVVPTNKNESGHPILVSKEICNHIKSLSGNEHILKDILSKFERISVETEDAAIHCNINAPKDLTQWGLLS